jgi:hypothetical protein
MDSIVVPVFQDLPGFHVKTRFNTGSTSGGLGENNLIEKRRKTLNKVRTPG